MKSSMKTTACAMVALGLTLTAPARAQDGFGRGEPVGETMPIGNRPGNPLLEMPPGQRMISAFGERPVFSPDGKRVAFIGKSYGDAFEYDLTTGRTRNLTSHVPHKGFVRVHYLADGSYLLLGPRFPAEKREDTRMTRIELFWMDARPGHAPVPLGQTVWEGIAVSRISPTVAWSQIAIDAERKSASTTVFTARVVTGGGTARLENIRRVVTTTECVAEAQDFLPGDAGLTMPCYRYGKDGSERADVTSIDFATGRLTTYPTPANMYGEVEALMPDGKRTLVECAGDRRKGMDLCLLDLDPANPRYTRITNIVQYGGYKYGNPTVRRDGRMVAAQIGPAEVIDAGVGDGIVLLDLRKDF